MTPFTDTDLAGMVKRSARLTGTFGNKFLVVLAACFGTEGPEGHVADAIDGFAHLLQDDDWKRCQLQVYEHWGRRFYGTTMASVEYGSKAAIIHRLEAKKLETETKRTVRDCLWAALEKLAGVPGGERAYREMLTALIQLEEGGHLDDHINNTGPHTD